MTEIVNNPHDKLFRETWSKLENARSFLQHYLPGDVLGLMDLDSLTVCKDSFVEKELADYYSDMLYAINIAGSSGFVYVLFEHKSWYEKYVHLQLLEYMVKIWQLFLKQQKGKHPKDPLPIIIPLLICHGGQAWPLERVHFSALMGGPVQELARYIPDFKFELYDLTGLSDDEIKGAIMTRVVMLLFKYSTHPQLRKKLPEILGLMFDLFQQKTGLQYLEIIMRYLFSTLEGVSKEEIKEIVEKSISNQAGGCIMTIAEKLRSEGKIEGQIEGKIEGKIENIEELYRFGVLTKAQMEKFMEPLKQQLQDLKLSENS
ncbi:MAG: Rpn family recombination-promoting nuclease/putative transposase [Desulfamplus sp.]|nr:Rpn family recombination-promoting nuclease/putative transposase [Desulfamplus sp.]